MSISISISINDSFCVFSVSTVGSCYNKFRCHQSTSTGRRVFIWFKYCHKPWVFVLEKRLENFCNKLQRLTAKTCSFYCYSAVDFRIKTSYHLTNCITSNYPVEIPCCSCYSTSTILMFWYFWCH